MKTGDRVLVTASREALPGRVIMCSPNEDSLMVELDDGEGLRVARGLYIGFLPLLRVPGDRQYRELVTGAPIEIEVLKYD